MIELRTYRPPQDARYIDSIDDLDKLDDAKQHQIVKLLSGPESFAKRNVLNIIDNLKKLMVTNKLLGHDDVKEYLEDLEETVKLEQKQARQKRAQEPEEQNDDGATKKRRNSKQTTKRKRKQQPPLKKERSTRKAKRKGQGPKMPRLNQRWKKSWPSSKPLFGTLPDTKPTASTNIGSKLRAGGS